MAKNETKEWFVTDDGRYINLNRVVWFTREYIHLTGYTQRMSLNDFARLAALLKDKIDDPYQC